mmetsp:Transcript_16686/g.24338  ORF Transcript_16686/g.24338 Transcript_16686/m.24338 type:complete len:91 (-) Transcript_16686:753-1025(-)
MLSKASGSMIKPLRTMKRYWRYHARLVIKAVNETILVILSVVITEKESMMKPYNTPTINMKVGRIDPQLGNLGGASIIFESGMMSRFTNL